jgi:hypothetical protein
MAYAGFNTQVNHGALFQLQDVVCRRHEGQVKFGAWHLAIVRTPVPAPNHPLIMSIVMTVTSAWPFPHNGRGQRCALRKQQNNTLILPAPELRQHQRPVQNLRNCPSAAQLQHKQTTAPQMLASVCMFIRACRSVSSCRLSRFSGDAFIEAQQMVQSTCRTCLSWWWIRSNCGARCVMFCGCRKTCSSSWSGGVAARSSSLGMSGLYARYRPPKYLGGSCGWRRHSTYHWCSAIGPPRMQHVQHHRHGCGIAANVHSRCKQ